MNILLWARPTLSWMSVTSGQGHKFVLPVGASGSIAADLWHRVQNDFVSYMPAKTPRRPFGVLGSASASNEAILDALFTLIAWLATRR